MKWGIIAPIIFGLLAVAGIIISGTLATKVKRPHIEVIDGCEYIRYGSFTHKGNCTNSIHQHNQ